MPRPLTPLALLVLLPLAPLARADDAPPSAERGKALLTGKAFVPAIWKRSTFDSLWTVWPDAPKQKPADYAEAVWRQYGLAPAPYPNDGLPMGLRTGRLLFRQGVTIDCLACHGGRVPGDAVGTVGAGGSSLDLQSLFDDLNKVEGIPSDTSFHVCRARGTNEAGALSVFLLGTRQPDLRPRVPRLDLGVHDDLCEDTPAWWHLKHKRTMYHNGGADARSVRSVMQFMMSPLNGPEAFAKAEPDFRDILAYIKSIEPPKYPLPIDRPLAARGAAVFARDCARCHGTYGDSPAYPNKIVPLDEIGTDRTRFEGIEPRFGEYYNKSWFAQGTPGHPARETVGYQAPPLDGVWATAPYLHNGSVPTVYDLLKSDARPTAWTRSFDTALSEYDARKLGWKISPPALPADAPPRVKRRVYDTREPGRGNGGHTFGDHLTDEERWAVIEYLKGL